MKINLEQIKRENDKILSQLELRDFNFLPVLKDEFSFKKTEEIKVRTFILSVIVQVSFDIIEPKNAIEYLEKYQLARFLTKKEVFFLKNGKQIDKNNETWKSECVWCLLWSLSIVDNIDNFSELADLNSLKIKDYPFVNINSNPSTFFENPTLKLRSTVDILKMLDIYSRLDYICDWYGINNLKTSFNSALIYERRYALIWLTSKIDWDKVECNSIL